MPGVAETFANIIETATGVALKVRIRAWDGSEAGPTDTSTVRFNRRRAFQHVLWSPCTLGLARGYICGDYDFEGDPVDILNKLYSRELQAIIIRPGLKALWICLPVIPKFLHLAGFSLPPPKIPEEIVHRKGWSLHSLLRDKEVVSHHYDVGNEFFEILLGESMTYSCAYFATPQTPLADAQKAKLDLICRKLSLKPGQRLLDVGCGWGSMSIHAAKYYGVNVVGVTIADEQVTYARKLVEKLGLMGRVEIRNQDYREVADGPFDAISSIGMAEHVGTCKYRLYAKNMFNLLRPGGRFLNHQISVAHIYKYLQPDPFNEAFVFPDGELATIGTTMSLLEKEGFEIRDVQSLRENYALTCKLWVKNIGANWDQMVNLTSEGRVRVWVLYLSMASIGFDKNMVGVNQVLAIRPLDEGTSGMPLTREEWMNYEPLTRINNN